MWFEKKRRKKKGTQPQPSPNPNRTHFNPAAQHLPETNPKLHAGPTSPVNQSPFSPGPAATSLPQPSPRDIAAQHLPSPRPDSRVRPVPSRVKLTAAQQRPLGRSPLRLGPACPAQHRRSSPTRTTRSHPTDRAGPLVGHALSLSHCPTGSTSQLLPLPPPAIPARTLCSAALSLPCCPAPPALAPEPTCRTPLTSARAHIQDSKRRRANFGSEVEPAHAHSGRAVIPAIQTPRSLALPPAL